MLISVAIPPGAGAGAPEEGAELGYSCALYEAMLGPRHGSADDLAVDELDPLLGVGEQIRQRGPLRGFHRLTLLDYGPSGSGAIP
jgi:hypothetical protein